MLLEVILLVELTELSISYLLNTLGDWNMFTASNKLYQEANSKIEWGKSFSCAASQNLTFTEVANITLLLGVSELKVQAFQFKNAISEEFDDGNFSRFLVVHGLSCHHPPPPPPKLVYAY